MRGLLVLGYSPFWLYRKAGGRMTKKQVRMYTDGACSGNPGPGGWAAILIYGPHTKEISGFEPETTNNRMEMTAVIEGFRALKEPCQVTVYSDSNLVVKAFNDHWLDNW